MMASETSEKSRLNPLFLIVPVLTVLAQWQESMSVLRFLADLCATWLTLWQEVWRRLFNWMEPYVLRTYPSDSYDMLTLVATLISTIGIGNIILSVVGKGSVVTTRDEVDRFIIAPSSVRLTLTGLIIVAALAVVIFPFYQVLDDTMARSAEESAARAVAAAQRAAHPWWYRDWMPAASLVVTAIGIFCMLLAFLVSYAEALLIIGGLILAAFGTSAALWLALVSPGAFGQSYIAVKWANYASLMIVPITVVGLAAAHGRSSNALRGMWLMGAINALIPIFYLWVPDVPVMGSLDISAMWTNPASALVSGLLASFIFIAARSALPLVHLAIIVVTIMLLDQAIGVFADVWTTVQAAG